MSKKSKMKEREEASYIAPCEDVVNVREDSTCIIDEDNL